MNGLLQRLKAGLKRSSRALSIGLNDGLSDGLKTFGGRKLSPEQLSELEDVLIMADLGVTAAGEICAALRTNLHTKRDLATLNEVDLKRALAEQIASQLVAVEKPLDLPAARPAVILVAGVNGAGKTTTIGKLAQRFMQEGKSVMLAACDTFRAAASEQLQVWGARAGVPVISGPQGADAASLAFQAFEQARNQQVDILMVDTAGRLQSNENLMAELEKITRVLARLDADAPHASLLVLDATTGQNAIAQAEAFLRAASITGLIMTKLDGTARGGGLVAIARKLALPVHFIGVGEQAEDLQVFNANTFANALTGADETDTNGADTEKDL